MSKKVLVISSSPRKGGNSDLLCDKFIQGANESGNNVEKVYLKDKRINYCSGCGFCVENGYNGCSQNDDMGELLEKLLVADAVVLATPVYFYSMCAQMKVFIDRCCAKYTKILNKEFYFIMTAADNDEKLLTPAIEGFHGFLNCLSNPIEKGAIFATGVWQKGDVLNTKYPEIAYEYGKNV